MTKLLENIFRCVNIALVNELKLLCQRMGVDVWEVIEAASSKPFGFMPFYPGPGLGGHCIPVDPFYLSWKAREYDFSTRFIELAGEVNTAMPYHVVDAIAEALNQHKKSLNGSKLLVLGVAYKKDVDDLRESPTLKIMEILQKRGASFDYNDPYFPAPAQDAPLRLFAHEVRSAEPGNVGDVRCGDHRHGSLQLRLCTDRGFLEAGNRHAQRHPASTGESRQNRSLLMDKIEL